MDENKDRKISVTATPDVQKGVFYNMAKVSANSREVVIDFAFADPVIPDQALLVSRVILTKEHALELKNVLNNFLDKHEKEVDTIEETG